MQLISIATFNIWGSIFAKGNFKKRAGEICQYFNNSGTDIIQFQEIFTYPKLRFFQKHLPYYPYCAYKKSLLGPRGGLVTFSKVPIGEIIYIEFDQKLIAGNLNPGITVTGKGMLAIRPKDNHLSLINTHLSPTYISPSYKTNPKNKERYDGLTKSQLHQLYKLIGKEFLKGNSVIITGDFNLAKDTDSYNSFLNQGLVDIFADHSSLTYHQEFAPDKKTAYRIDFIFLRALGTFTVVSKNQLFTDNPLSDHIGLEAKVQLKT